MKRIILAAVVLCGCGGALTTKSEPTAMRYFSPEEAVVRTTSAAAAQSTAPKVRLGRVHSSAALRSRIVHRDSPWEVGMYETLRWTDNPEVYVRRALARALFDDGIAREAVGSDAPTLDVELVAFEINRSRGHGGRVELRWELRDDVRVVASGVVSSEQPADAADMGALVAAIGRALSETADSVAQKTVAALHP